MSGAILFVAAPLGSWTPNYFSPLGTCRYMIMELDERPIINTKLQGGDIWGFSSRI